MGCAVRDDTHAFIPIKMQHKQGHARRGPHQRSTAPHKTVMEALSFQVASRFDFPANCLENLRQNNK